MIVLGFSFTRLVVNGYEAKRQALAKEYYAAGSRVMDEWARAVRKNPRPAVHDFETALIYSHGDLQYELKLTEALAASGRTDEALSLLRALREQQPENAQVNLKLARLEAHRQHADEALRYFHSAVEGAWPDQSDPVPLRIAARFDEAEYLVELGRKEQAEAALAALATVLPENSTERGKLAELFLRNGDPGEALKIYETSLKLCAAERRARMVAESGPAGEPALKPPVSGNEARDARCQGALLGAANASFAAAEYAAARRYLEELKSEGPETAKAQELRLELERMEALDPFARSATETMRTLRTIAAFQIAVERLAGCGVPFAQVLSHGENGGNAKDPAQWSELAKWAEQLAPRMRERKLRGRDDVIESTMRFVFRAEMAAQKECGKPALNDEALLLLGRERMGAN